jgi:IS30 family transposase
MTHITVEQRYTISELLNNGYSDIQIGSIIKKDRSSIYRERKRNSDNKNQEYKYELAQKKADVRKKSKPKYSPFTEEIKSEVKLLLEGDLSPEQVTGLMKDEGKVTVSHETIYQYVWEDKSRGGDLHSHLRNNGRKYRKRGSYKDSRGIIKNKQSIDQRPSIVDKKVRFGDIEIDLIIGMNHQQAIVTINDRVSGVLKMGKVKSKEAHEVRLVVNDLLEEWIPYIHTITSDNGKEFAQHEEIAGNLMIDYYFAHPYHSWERGANENLNGLIRQYFPKKTDFTIITDQQVKAVETKLNNRPRKRHGFKTPLAIMDKLLFNENVAFMG